MTTKHFIQQLNDSIAPEGYNLITEFFISFSRFECALKASSFANENNGKVTANWETFIATIAIAFNLEKTPELKRAVEYIIKNPPRIQSLDNNRQLIWKERIFQPNQPVINKLLLSIRDIRNNLFHGGKFNGNYQQDVSRNYILLKHSIFILNEWLDLNTTVKQNFLISIS